MAALGALLAWPDGSGVLGSFLMMLVTGTPAYMHAHRRSERQHAERMAQASAHHRELAAHLAAAAGKVRP